MNITAKEAAKALQNADDILILTHRRPDGDTAGSAGALCRGLRALGKTAYILENPEITNRYANLITKCYNEKEFNEKYIIAVDIAEESLFTENAAQYKGKINLVIDHHRSNPFFGEQNLVIPEAGACGEVVYAVLSEMGVALTKDIAECIYVAISTDTGCFRYSNTTVQTLHTAAACLAAGIDGGEINRRLFEIKTHARIGMECRVFSGMEFYQEEKIALAQIFRKDIEETNADMDDLDAIAALPRQVDGVQIGITLTENKNGTVKASVRTTKEMDASKICAAVGGGGHLRAAGASFSCGMEKAKALILKAAEDEYHGRG